MIGFGHTSVGVLVAIVVERAIPTVPLWSQALTVFVVSLVSHYIMDVVPHGHYTYDPKHPFSKQALILWFDLVGFAGLILLLVWWQYGWGSQLLLVAVGIVGAQLTDVWDWVVVANGWVPLEGIVLKHRRLHQWTHWHDNVDSNGKRTGRWLTWWDLWQVVVALLAITLLMSGV